MRGRNLEHVAFRGIGQTFYLVMAGLVPAIPVDEAAPFPIEMAGESSPHAASVSFAKTGAQSAPLGLP
jgi:hypothetical protein